MKWFDDLRLRHKLIVGFGLLILISAVAQGYSIFNIRQIDAETNDIVRRTKEVIAYEEFQLDLLEQDLLEKEFLLSKDPALLTRYEEVNQLINRHLKEAETLLHDSEEQANLQELTQLRMDYQQIFEQVVALQQAGQHEEATRISLNTSDAKIEEMHQQVEGIIANQRRLIEEEAHQADIQTQQSETFGVISLIVAFILGVGISIFFIRSIAGPLALVVRGSRLLSVGDTSLTGISQSERESVSIRKDEIGEVGRAFNELVCYLLEMVGAAERIADGDLTVDVQPKSPADTLGNANHHMINKLRHLIGNVAHNATTVASTSDQLAAVAEQTGQATAQIVSAIYQVSQGVQQQAGSILQTKGSIQQVSHAVNGVAQGAQEQAQAITHTSQSLGQLTESIRSIATSAEKQSQVVGQAKAANNSLDMAVAQITERTEQVADFIKANLQTAQSGQQASRDAISGIDQLGATTEQLAQRIRELGKRSAQIGAIVETIDDIASQTNLLALNAAIESARAGEHGKGFAVVADEVRKLAERSSQATKEIQTMIETVQAGTEQAVEAMGQARHDVQTGVTLTRQAGAAFEAITSGTAGSAEQVEATLKAVQVIRTAAEQLRQSIESVDQVTEQNRLAARQMQGASEAVLGSMEQVSAVIEENSALTEEMAASTNEVTTAIENIALVSEENSASVEEVSASTEEMSAQVQEVAASVRALTQMAQALQSLVAQFKLTDSSVSQPVSSSVMAAVPLPQVTVMPLAVVERNGYH